MHDDITICTPLAVVQKESSASRMPKVTKTNNQPNKQTNNKLQKLNKEKAWDMG